MSKTDNPLKIVVREFAPDFAAWLLDVDKIDISHVRSVNIELSTEPVRSDMVFHVTLTGDRATLLHIEFQGPRSKRPMSLRMLDYMSHLAQQEQSDLCSVVLYVGDGAGAGDDGIHQVDCPVGGLSLAWHYRVIRLWQMRAEDFLILNRPALLTLIGQTHIKEPENILPQVVKTIGQTPDVRERSRLFAALASLMRDEEVLEMVEQLVKAIEHEPLLNTPLLRRVREEGRGEGWSEGRVEGRVDGMIESILDVLTTRLGPSVSTYRRLERRLASITDLGLLRDLLQAAARADDITDFEKILYEPDDGRSAE